jgi:hypothetical protein
MKPSIRKAARQLRGADRLQQGLQQPVPQAVEQAAHQALQRRS